MRTIDKIKDWLGLRPGETGVEPTATPPEGSLGQPEQETSTNAQTQGASDEPWSGSR